MDKENEYKEALELLERSWELKPVYDHEIFLHLEEARKTIAEVDKALRLDPLNPTILSLCGVVFLIAGRFGESIQLFNNALRIFPDFNFALSNLAEALYLSGRVDEALEKYKAYYAIMNLHNVVEAIDKGINEGSCDKALVYMAEALERKFQEDYWTPFEIAWRCVQAGDKNKALNWLDIGYEKRDQNIPYLYWPLLDPLRDEPRFQEIARKMNLPLSRTHLSHL